MASAEDIAKAKEKANKLLKQEIRDERALSDIQADKVKVMRDIARLSGKNYGTVKKAFKIKEQERSLDKELKTLIEDQAIATDDRVVASKKILDAKKREIARQEELNASFDKYKEAWEDFKAIASDPKIAAGLFLVAAADKAKDMAETLLAAQKSMGLSYTQGVKMAGTLVSAAGSGLLLGITLEETAEAGGALVDQFGNLGDVTSAALVTVAELGHKYGVASSEAAGLYKQIKLMSGGTDDMVKSQIEYVENLARANGVAPGKVIADMAGNAEFMAKFMGKNSKSMAQTAVQAQKLGVSMSAIGSMMDNILDIDSAIEKEMQVSVLLGRQISFDKARQLAMAGKTVEATKEILAQVGGIAEFEKMSVIQRKALADAAGVDLATMQSMLGNREKQIEMGLVQASSYEETLGYVKGIGETTMNSLPIIGTAMNMMASVAQISGASWVTDKLKWAQTKIFNAYAKAVALKNRALAALGYGTEKSHSAWKFGEWVRFQALVLGAWIKKKMIQAWDLAATAAGFVAKAVVWALEKAHDVWKLGAIAVGLARQAVVWALERAHNIWKLGAIAVGLARQSVVWLLEKGHSVWKLGAIAMVAGAAAAMWMKEKAHAAWAWITGRKAHAQIMVEKKMQSKSGGGGSKAAAKGGKGGGGGGGLTKMIEKIKPGKLLAGAAAMILVAAAVFVFAKAVQQFMSVSWEAVGMAVVSMLALVGAVALLGAIMMSGVGAVAIILGAAAMLIVAGAMLVLAIALKIMSEAIPNFMLFIPMLPQLAVGLFVLAPAIPLMPLIGYGLIAMGLGFGIAAIGVGLFGMVGAPEILTRFATSISILTPMLPDFAAGMLMMGPVIPMLFLLGLAMIPMGVGFGIAAIALAFFKASGGIEALSSFAASISTLVPLLPGFASAMSAFVPLIPTFWLLGRAMLPLGIAFGMAAVGLGLFAASGGAESLAIFASAITIITPLMPGFVTAMQMLGPITPIFYEVGLAMIPFGIGMAAAAIGVGLFGAVGGAHTITALAAGMSILTPLTQGIAALGPAFASMALGIALLAGSLFLLTPMLPTLLLLGALSGGISAIMGGGKEEGSSGGEGDKGGGSEAIIRKLDELIGIMSQGGDINMDGKKVGEVLALARGPMGT